MDNSDMLASRSGAGARLTERAGRGAIAALTLASGMAVLDLTAVMVALPQLGTQLRIGLSGLQWVVAGYALTLVAFVLLGGALGERYGRRLVFTVGVAGFGLGSALSGLADGLGALVAARCAQGLSAALLIPGSHALIASTFGTDHRAQATRLWAWGNGLALVIGPLLGGLLVETLSWRWVFFLHVPLAVLVIGLTVWCVPESRSRRQRARFDVPGALLAALLLAGVSYGLIEGSVFMVGLGVAAGAGFFAVERRSTAPLLPPALFRVRWFISASLATVCITSAVCGAGFFLVLFLQVSAGYSAVAAGAALLPAVVLGCGAAQADAMAGQVAPRVRLVLGGVSGAAGCLLLLGAGTGYAARVLPGLALVGLGLALVIHPLRSAVLAAAPEPLGELATGANCALAAAAGLLAVVGLPALAGLSAQAYPNAVAFADGYRIAIWFCAGLLVCGTGAAVTLPRRAVGRPRSGAARDVRV